MKNEIVLAIAVMYMALLITPASAACSGVCDTSLQYSCSKSISTLTKGTSTALTITITNQQSNAVNSLAAQLLGNWFSASSSSTTISSIQANGGTANAEFSITPTVSGGQGICVYLGSTCTADCGTVTVTSAAEMSVTSVTAPSSATVSSTFTVSATIANSGTEAAGSTSAITATLSSSQCTVASGTKTVGTITGSGTSSTSWTVTAPSSATTCTFSLSATGTPGGTATSSKSVTISAAASSDTSTSSSSGGGGGGAASSATEVAGTKVATANGKTTITIPEIKAGTAALVKIDKPAETGVVQIAVDVKNTVRNITIVVSRVDKPAVSQPADKLFGYLQIDKVNMTDADVNSVSIDFQVDKAWLNANKIDKSTVALQRYANGAWAALATKQTAESDAYATYRAESPGLSVFAITGKELPKPAATATPITTPKPTTVVEIPQIVKDYGIWIFVFLAAAIALGYLYYHHEHARKTLKKYQYSLKSMALSGTI